MESHADHDDEQVLSFDFSQYIDGLRKYAWMILALMALAVTLAVVYTGRLPRIYEARASLLLEPRLPDLLGQGEDILSVSSRE